MNTEIKCPECGSTRLAPGSIQSTGRIYFRPTKTPFLTLGTNDVPIEATLCMECGNLILLGDLKKAGRLLERAMA